MCLHIPTHTYICIMYIYIYIHINMYIHICTCIYINTYTCICVYLYISESQDHALSSFRSYLLLGISLQIFASLFASRVLGLNARANWRKVRVWDITCVIVCFCLPVYLCVCQSHCLSRSFSVCVFVCPFFCLSMCACVSSLLESWVWMCVPSGQGYVCVTWRTRMHATLS